MGVCGTFGFVHGVYLLLAYALCKLSAPTLHEALTSVLVPRAFSLCSHCTISNTHSSMKYALRFGTLHRSLGS